MGSVVDLTAKLLFLASEDLALLGIALPNKSVKGTRRPLAILEFVFFIKVRRLRLSSQSGAPLTVTLGVMTNLRSLIRLPGRSGNKKRLPDLHD